MRIFGKSAALARFPRPPAAWQSADPKAGHSTPRRGHSCPALCACRRKGKGRPLRRRRDTPSFPSAPDAHTSSVCANASRALQGPSNGAPSPFAVPFGPLRWRPLTTARPVPPRLSTARRPWQGPAAAAAAAGFAALAPSSGRAGWSGWASPRSAPPPMAGPPLGLPSAVLSRAGPGPWASPPPVPVRSAAGGLSLRPAGRRSRVSLALPPPCSVRAPCSLALLPPVARSVQLRLPSRLPSALAGAAPPRAPSGYAVLRPPGAPTPCRRFGLPIVAPCQGRLRRRPWRSRLGKRALGARANLP